MLPGLDRLAERIGDAGCAHLGGEVIGGHLLRGNQYPILAWLGWLVAPAEEVCDMGVLLGLGGAELGAAVSSQHLGHDVGHAERRERDRDGEGLVVLRHRDAADPGPAGHVEAVESVDCQGAHNLAHAVTAVIEAEHRVAIANRRDRLAAPLQHDGVDELVGLAPVVRGIHRGHGIGHRRAYTVHHGFVGNPGALPAAVPVHGVVAARERGDDAGAAGDAGQVLLQPGNNSSAQGGRGIPSVEETLDGDAGNTKANTQFDTGDQVTVDGVHAAGAEEADQVKCSASALEVAAQLDEWLKREEVAAGDALGDPDEVLGHYAAGAQVEVANFAVAHLALGEADRQAARLQQCPGRFLP